VCEFDLSNSLGLSDGEIVGFLDLWKDEIEGFVRDLIGKY
jgi:hypothetical protein